MNVIIRIGFVLQRSDALDGKSQHLFQRIFALPCCPLFTVIIYHIGRIANHQDNPAQKQV